MRVWKRRKRHLRAGFGGLVNGGATYFHISRRNREYRTSVIVFCVIPSFGGGDLLKRENVSAPCSNPGGRLKHLLLFEVIVKEGDLTILQNFQLSQTMRAAAS